MVTKSTYPNEVGAQRSDAGAHLLRPSSEDTEINSVPCLSSSSLQLPKQVITEGYVN